MQRIIYEDSPYVVLFYDNWLEVYREEKFTGWTKQPESNGSLQFNYGAYNYLNLEPASAEGGDSEDGGSNTTLFLIGGLLGVAIIVGIVLRSRRGSMEDRA